MANGSLVAVDVQSGDGDEASSSTANAMTLRNHLGADELELIKSLGSSRSLSPINSTPRSHSSKNGSLQDLNGEGGEEAPLCFEPCGSAEMSPNSDSVVPPYMRWAVDLSNLLEDYEGVNLFRQYLYQECCDNMIEFWFACKALTGFSASADQEKIVSVGRAIYNKYIRSHGDRSLATLAPSTRVEITKRITEKRMLNQCTFDDALVEIQQELRVRHAAFVRSEIYIQHVQAMQNPDLDSPKACSSGHASQCSSSSSSNSGENPRQCPVYLPTVHEASEAEDGQLDSSSNSGVVNESEAHEVEPNHRTINQHQHSKVPISSSSAAVNNNESSTTFSGGGVSGTQAPCGNVVRSPGRSPSGTLNKRRPQSSRLTTSNLVASLTTRNAFLRAGAQGSLPPNPYHTSYVPFLPASAQDSELQSLSSDADSMSMTDSSIDAFPLRPTKKHQIHKQQQFIRRSAQQNRDLEVSQTVIPRTQRPIPKEAQQPNPEEFAALLIEKLNKVQRDMEGKKTLKEFLHTISDEADGSSTSNTRAAIQQFCRNAPTFHNDDEHVSILDEHVSRVWQDSPKQSPLRSPGPTYLRKRSPGSKSPDRRNALRFMTSSYPLPQPAQLPVAASTPGGAGILANRLGEAVNNLMLSSSSKQHRSAHHASSGNPNSSRGVAGAVYPPVPAKSSKLLTTIATDAPAGYLPADRRPGTSATSSGKIKASVARPPVPMSDTSGIESGSSSASMASTTKLDKTQDRVHQWMAENDKFSQSVTEPGDHTSFKQKRPSVPSASAYRNSGHKQPGDIASSSKAKAYQKSSPSSEPSSAPQTMRRKAAATDADSCITVGYFLPSESMPFLTKHSGRQITLKQFKQLITRKGTYRYFFKCASDEMGTGVVMREVIDDYEVLPMWDGKVVAKVLPAE